MCDVLDIVSQMTRALVRYSSDRKLDAELFNERHLTHCSTLLQHSVITGCNIITAMIEPLHVTKLVE